LPNDEGVDLERLLVDRIVAGDRAAGAKLVALCEPLVTYLLKVRLGLKPYDVADLSQELWVRLAENRYRRLLQWNRNGSLVSFIGTIAYRLGLDYLDAQSRWANRVDPADDTHVPHPNLVNILSPERLAEATEILDLVQRCLAQLPPAYTRVLTRRRVDEQSAAVVAEAEGITANHVNVTLYRAEKRLIACIRNAHPGLFSGTGAENDPDFL